MAERPNMLSRLLFAGQAHAEMSRLTRNPDPEPKHEYEADPHSGAGNCWCGAAEHHRNHPHEFTPALSDPDLCVCALPAEARCHRADTGPRADTGRGET